MAGRLAVQSIMLAVNAALTAATYYPFTKYVFKDISAPAEGKRTENGAVKPPSA